MRKIIKTNQDLVFMLCAVLWVLANALALYAGGGLLGWYANAGFLGIYCIFLIVSKTISGFREWLFRDFWRIER